MKPEDYRHLDGIALAQAISSKQISATEALEAALAQLDSVNPTINAITLDLREAARKTAKAFDQLPLNERPHSRLAGVPFALKDLIADWKDTPTSYGNRLLCTIPAQSDSDLSAAYRQAGLHVIAKTTTPEFGLMPYTETTQYGITRNPWNPLHTSGGSSGGAAALVAAQVLPFAHGGDGGGSIRIPASNCGLFGLKPSRGRVSSGPLTDAWLGMVAEHALTRSVRDSAALLDIATQASGSTPALYHCPPLAEAPSFYESLSLPLRRLRIAVTDQPWFDGEVDPVIKTAHQHTLSLLESLGHHIEYARPHFTDSDTLGRAMLVVLAGETAKAKRHIETALKRRITFQDVEPTTWSLMVYGEHISAGEAFWARDIIMAQAAIAAQFHQQYDILCTPVLPRLTPKVGELAPSQTEEKAAEMLLGRLKLGVLMKYNPVIDANSRRSLAYVGFTSPFNMTGQPAMSVPLYQHQGLPIGSQFVAAHGNEALLLQLAKELEEAQPWFNLTPPLLSQH